jgi:uncharacterized protein
MKIDLRRLEQERDGRGVLTEEETFTITDAFGRQRTVDCRTELSWARRGGAFFFHGELASELNTQCHLCLEDVVAPLTGEFDVVLRKGGDRGVHQAGEDEETEELVTLSPNQREFSFDPYIIENLIVNVPMQILCKEDCKGLCPHCGINRNRSTCDCQESSDSRWDALRKLKND